MCIMNITEIQKLSPDNIKTSKYFNAKVLEFPIENGKDFIILTRELQPEYYNTLMSRIVDIYKLCRDSKDLYFITEYGVLLDISVNHKFDLHSSRSKIYHYRSSNEIIFNFIRAIGYFYKKVSMEIHDRNIIDRVVTHGPTTTDIGLHCSYTSNYNNDVIDGLNISYKNFSDALYKFVSDISMINSDLYYYLIKSNYYGCEISNLNELLSSDCGTTKYIKGCHIKNIINYFEMGSDNPKVISSLT